MASLLPLAQVPPWLALSRPGRGGAMLAPLVRMPKIHVWLDEVPYALLEDLEFWESTLRLPSAPISSSCPSPAPKIRRLTLRSHTSSNPLPRSSQTRNTPPVSGVLCGWSVTEAMSGGGKVSISSVWVHDARGALVSALAQLTG